MDSPQYLPSDQWLPLYPRAQSDKDNMGPETADIDANTEQQQHRVEKSQGRARRQGGKMMRRWPFQGFDGLGHSSVRKHPHRSHDGRSVDYVPKESPARNSQAQRSPKMASIVVVRLDSEIDGFRRPKTGKQRRQLNPYVTLTVVGQRAVIRGIMMKTGEALPVAVDGPSETGAGANIIEQT